MDSEQQAQAARQQAVAELYSLSRKTPRETYIGSPGRDGSLPILVKSPVGDLEVGSIWDLDGKKQVIVFPSLTDYSGQITSDVQLLLEGGRLASAPRGGE